MPTIGVKIKLTRKLPQKPNLKSRPSNPMSQEKPMSKSKYNRYGVMGKTILFTSLLRQQLLWQRFFLFQTIPYNTLSWCLD